MSRDPAAVKAAAKQYILDEFLPGTDAEELTDDTPLLSGGILDSISTVKLVSFLENEYGVAFEAHEMSADYLDTLVDIAQLVTEKAAA